MFEEKIRCFNKYFGAFFLPFRANYGFPVVVHGRPEGRKEGRTEGNVRTRGIPVSVHEKSTRWIYHFFLAMVLRSRGPSARAGAPIVQLATEIHKQKVQLKDLIQKRALAVHNLCQEFDEFFRTTQ